MAFLQRSDERRTSSFAWLMHSLIPLSCLIILVSGVFLFYSSSQLTKARAEAFVVLPGHIPALVRSSQRLGPASSSTPLTLMIGLQLRHQGDLETFVNNQKHAAAPRYLSPDQVERAYAPLPSSEQSVIAYMQGKGFTVSSTFRHHLLIGFQGTIGEAEQAFQVQIQQYRAPNGRRFYAPTSEPSIPASLAGIIQSIGGLDTAAHLSHPPVRPIHLKTHVSGGVGAASCPAASGTTHSYYTPGQIASAYGLNGLYSAGYRGEGQSVGLFELDDYQPGDISAYTSCYGGALVPIHRILVAGGTGQAPDSGATEVELDMELVLSAAPHLAGLYVYEAANDPAGILSEWGQIISDAVPVISTSWGACELQVTQKVAQEENTLFAVAAAQGQSVIAADGDHGTDDCDNSQLATAETVDDPASQPFVTSVGGTSLTLNTNGEYASEQVWNNGRVNGQFTGGGGGVSTFWTMPDWQSGPGVVNAAYSSMSACAQNTGNTGKYCREIPDVSLNADPNTGYIMYCTVTVANCSAQTPWFTIGGTSAAAPLWAAMVALANEKSLHDGNFNLGFLNPLLYQIGQSQAGTSYANDFHDIQSGNNSAFNDGKYTAGVGYDLATGWGSYNAASLATDLEKVAAAQTSLRASPASQTWYFAEGSVGGSFSEFLTLLNPSTTQAANVTITYLFENRPALTRQHSIAPSSRATVSVNGDLGVAPSAGQVALSAMIQADLPIVAERPMYFTLHGIASGTDTVGATSTTHTTFYFAEGDSRQDATRSYYTFVTLLNPSNTSTAHVTINYYSGGRVVGTQQVNVGPLHRGTGSPAAVGLRQQVAIKVSSDSGIVVERPMYFRDNIASAGGVTTGAATAVGAVTTGNDWLFAEGHVGPGSNFQEYLVLANFDESSASTTVKLEYANGTIQAVNVMVPGQSQYYFDVNAAFSQASQQICSCTPTPDVSAEVVSTSTSLIAERLIYFHFGPARLSGGSDVVGEAGPSSHTAYSFAEGFTSSGFSEFLTLQNPNNTPVTVAITLYADNTIMQVDKQLQPHSRSTLSINSLVVPLASAYPTSPAAQGYQVSMDIQALNGTVVAERPMYFNFHHQSGGTDVLGYTG